MKKLAVLFLVGFLAAITFAPQAANAEVVIKFGHAGMSETSAAEVGAQIFKKLVEKYSNGEIKVEIFPKAQMGGEQQMTQALQLGTLEMQWIATNNLTPRVRSLGYFNLPYIVKSLEQAERLQEGSWEFAQAATIKEANVRLLGWEVMGFRVFFNSKKPINTVADMKGLVWRVPKDDILVGNYEAWGVHPQPMAWHELFNALTQGVVHGGGNPWDDIVTAKLYEPCKYLTPMHYHVLSHCILIAEPFFQKLTPQQQEWVTMAGKGMTDYLKYDLKFVTNPEKINFLKNAPGIKINEPTDEPSFYVAQKNWPKFYKSIGLGDEKRGEQIVKEAEEIASYKREKFSENLIVK